jgi:hypothetical protein
MQTSIVGIHLEWRGNLRCKALELNLNYRERKSGGTDVVFRRGCGDELSQNAFYFLVSLQTC